MKKFFTLALTAVIALSMLTACGSKDNASDDNKGEEGGTTAALSGTVSTDGSTSMEKVINSLGESFMAANKDVKFTYNPPGSGQRHSGRYRGTLRHRPFEPCAQGR